MSFGPFAALPSLAATGMTPTSGTSALSSLAQKTESNIASALAKGVESNIAHGAKSLFSGEFLLRGVTLLLGLLLIAAGLFSHPVVREKIVSAGKVAGKVAAVAA